MSPEDITAPRNTVQISIQYYRQGRFEASRVALEPLLARYPQDAYLFNIHCALCLQLKDYPAAVTAGQRALELRPDYLEAMGNLASAYYELSDFTAAKNTAKALLALDPADLTGLVLATECALLGEDLNAAEWWVSDLIRRHPSNGMSWYLNAKLQRQKGHLAQALQACQRSLSLDASRESVVILYVSLLLESEQYDEAEVGLQHAMRAWPNSRGAIHLKAQLLLAQGMPEQAADVYERLLAGNFEESVALNLANVYRQLGHYDEAKTILYRVLDQNAVNARAILVLSQMPLDPKQLPSLVTMAESVLMHEQLNLSDQAHVAFALGALYARQEDYKQSFQAYKRANAIRAKQHPYDEVADKRLLSEIIKTYRVLESYSLPPIHCSITPVFIVGLPRSGSTLLEHKLLEHEGVASLGESEFLNRELGIWLREFDGSAKCMEALRDVFKRYVKILESRGAMNSVVIDKLLLNYRWVGVISLLLPSAKFIWLDKKPIAACWSLYKQQFAGYEFSYQFDTLVSHYARYNAYKTYWQGELLDKIAFVSYEEWMSAPANISASIYRFLALTPSRDAFAGVKKGILIDTLSSSQVREPISSRFVDEWQHYQNELKPLENSLESALGSNFGFGYGE